MAGGPHSSLISRRDVRLFLICLTVIFLAFAFENAGARKPISSAETRFVEQSPRGLQIVPASCASVPPNPHDGGSCSGNGACNIRFSPDPVALNQSSTLFWSAPSGGSGYTLSYPGGSNPVSNVGSGSVGGDQTKTYTLSYNGVSDAGALGAPVSCSAVLTVCPAGQVVQNGQCVPNVNQCPSGQHLSGSSCLCDNTNQAPVNGQCPASGSCSLSFNPKAVVFNGNSTLTWTIAHPGIIYYTGSAPGSFPVSQSGSGATGGEQTKTYSFQDGSTGEWCADTLTVCPAGYTVNAQGTACIPPGQCTPQYFCQGKDLYQKVGAQCTNQFVQACAWGCSGADCLPPPSPQGNITATPSLVHTGETSEISWTSQYTSSCTVTEDNPDINDSWTGITGTKPSSGITQQTIYTLRCIGLDSSTFVDTTKVNIVPVFEEN